MPVYPAAGARPDSRDDTIFSLVVNPTNGHAHYAYLLRGWIRINGAESSDLAAVRYFAAIERAYTRALRADAGYAGLVQHNPIARNSDASADAGS